MKKVYILCIHVAILAAALPAILPVLGVVARVFANPDEPNCMTRHCVEIPFEQHPDYEFPVNKWCRYNGPKTPGLAYTYQSAHSSTYGKRSVPNASPAIDVQSHIYRCECQPDCPNVNPVSGTNIGLIDRKPTMTEFKSECQVILDPPPDPQPDPDP